MISSFSKHISNSLSKFSKNDDSQFQNVPCNTILSGSVAERSKALVLGTSHFDGVGSNPTAATS